MSIFDDHIEAKQLIDPFTNQPWNVLIVLPGQASLANEHRKNGGPEAIIEFFDARQEGEHFGPLGQFVSNYYVSNLVELNGSSLDLYGAVPNWWVSSDLVVAAINHCFDVLHANLS